MRDQLDQLTLEEQAALCSGQNFWQTCAIPRLNIPAIFLADGPHGVRKQADHFERVDIRGLPATCFPPAATVANSWDRELLRALGGALGEEARELGVAVLLGPGINIKRSPLCGRNFEYFSEDPLLSGELAASWIDGVQSKGVGASLKHFAANNQEYRRLIIDVRVDRRALREIYLAGFEIAIKRAQPWTVMVAYNKLNGEYCCENDWLLQTVLRDEWGFRGAAISDWGAVNDGVAAVRAGLDLEMPSSSGLNAQKIIAAIASGELEPAALQKNAGRVLSLVSTAQGATQVQYRCDREAHHALARRAAAESIVLLKNDRDLLPLQRQCKIAIIGAFAERPRYQGTGSSQINPWRVDTVLQVLAQHDVNFSYAPGYPRDGENIDEQLLADACAVAAAADAAILFVGLPESGESEGFDRKHMRMPESHNRLIERVAASNANAIVVLASGAPLELPWLENVPAVIAAYLGGQAGAAAIIDILFGTANPGGKLAETWPLRLEDTPAFNYFPGGPRTVEYRESIFVGYRFYHSANKHSANKAVAFPFGHGLSYTCFDYSALQLSAPRIDAGSTVQVTLTVGNIGTVAGAEIVQLYVRDIESTVFRPDRELRAFTKLTLQPGESRRIEFALDYRAFAYFDTDSDDWQIESGEFDILVGASSADIRAQARVFVQSSFTAAMHSDLRVAAPVYYRLRSGDVAPRRGLLIDDAQYGALYGAALPSQTGNVPFHLNSMLGEVRSTLLGKWLHGIALHQAQAVAKRSSDAVLEKMMEEIVAEMPLRQLVVMSGGRLRFETMDALIAVMNGQIWRGIRQLFAVRRTRR